MEKMSRKNIDSAKLRQAAEVLLQGGVIVIPTDTVYGLAASAFNAAAQKRIYRLKGRSYRKPLVVMPPDIDALEPLVEVAPRARRLMERFWPGPLTLILPTASLGKMVTGGRQDLGVRIPDDPVVLALLKLCGFPLATTSANPSSRPSATTGKEAGRYFKGAVDLVIDAGAAPLGRESTVVDMTHFHCVVIREGCLPSKQLLKYL